MYINEDNIVDYIVHKEWKEVFGCWLVANKTDEILTLQYNPCDKERYIHIKQKWGTNDIVICLSKDLNHLGTLIAHLRIKYPRFYATYDIIFKSLFN